MNKQMTNQIFKDWEEKIQDQASRHCWLENLREAISDCFDYQVPAEFLSSLEYYTLLSKVKQEVEANKSFFAPYGRQGLYNRLAEIGWEITNLKYTLDIR